MRENLMLSIDPETKKGIKEYAIRQNTSVSQIAERFFAYLVESDSTPVNRFIFGGRTYNY